MKYAASIALLLVLALSVSADWIGERGDAQRTNYAPITFPTAVTNYSYIVYGNLFNYITISSDNILYHADSGGSTRAYNITNFANTLLWSNAGWGGIVGTDGDYFYYINGENYGALKKVNRFTGADVWTTSRTDLNSVNGTGSGCIIGPAAVYCVSTNRTAIPGYSNIVKVDKSTGSTTWISSEPGETERTYMSKPSVSTDGSTICANGYYPVSYNARFRGVCFRDSDGQRIWKVQELQGWDGTMNFLQDHLIVDNTYFVWRSGTNSGTHIYAYYLNGTLAMNYTMAYGAALSTDGSYLYMVGYSTTKAFSITSWTQAWSVSGGGASSNIEGYGPLLSTNNLLIKKTDSNTYVALDKTNGATVWTLSNPYGYFGGARTSLFTMGGKSYLASSGSGSDTRITFLGPRIDPPFVVNCTSFPTPPMYVGDEFYVDAYVTQGSNNLSESAVIAQSDSQSNWFNCPTAHTGTNTCLVNTTAWTPGIFNITCYANDIEGYRNRTADGQVEILAPTTTTTTTTTTTSTTTTTTLPPTTTTLAGGNCHDYIKNCHDGGCEEEVDFCGPCWCGDPQPPLTIPKPPTTTLPKKCLDNEFGYVDGDGEPNCCPVGGYIVNGWCNACKPGQKLVNGKCSGGTTADSDFLLLLVTTGAAAIVILNPGTSMLTSIFGKGK